VAVVREKVHEARDRWHHLDGRDRARVAGATLLVSLLLVLGLLTVWQYARFRVLPLQNLPDRISWCGRRYLGGGEPRPFPDGEWRGFAFEFAPPLSPHHDVYVTSPIPDPRVDGEVCAVVLFVRTDSGFVAYALEGGP
jgi:hypothetical protein